MIFTITHRISTVYTPCHDSSTMGKSEIAPVTSLHAMNLNLDPSCEQTSEGKQHHVVKRSPPDPPFTGLFRGSEQTIVTLIPPLDHRAADYTNVLWTVTREFGADELLLVYYC